MNAARKRIIDGMRDVGILLITFGALDTAIAHADPLSPWIFLLFVTLGLLLFSGSILIEVRRPNEH